MPSRWLSPAAAFLFLAPLAAHCAPAADEATASAGSAALSTVNIVSDPSFELQYGTTLAGPWQGSATIELGNTQSTKSSHGYRDVLLRADSGWNPVQEWITVKPFSHYVASVAVESSDNLNDAYFSVRSGATWQVLNQVHFGSVGSSAYKTLSFEFDTGSDTSALLYVGFWANAPATWLRIDDVNVRQAPSAVTNGAFEGSTSGWQITGSSALDSASPHTGKAALTLSGTSGWTSANQWIAVAKNTRYRASAWIRTSASAVDGWFSVRGGPSFDVINQLHFGQAPGDYQNIQFEFDSGANTSVLLYAGFWGPGAPSYVELDDVVVESAAPLVGSYGYGNYGYVARYDCGETEAVARAKIDTMVSRFHVTDVQFYDWMASYDTPTQGASWTDAYFHSRGICLQTIAWYIDELHKNGARAWAYVQSVAAEKRGLDTAGSGIVPLLHGGQPYCMRVGGACTGDGQYPTYLDNAAWADHQVAAWAPGVAALGFDGIHWDTLGSIADDKAAETAGVRAFLREAAGKLAPYHLMQTMNFVGMAWWDPSLLDSVAFLYSEAWNGTDEANVFTAMSSSAMQARGGVMPFYPSTNDDGSALGDTSKQESALIARWFTGKSHNVRYLVVGDGNERLVNEYFPADTALSEPIAIELAQ